MTRTWVGSGPPPAKCYVKENAAAGAGAVSGPVGSGDPTGTVSAADGLGDAPTGDPGIANSQGSHLIQVDSSSGVIALSASVSASADSGGQNITSTAGASFSWDFDPRGLSLSSSLGQTYHKDQSTGQRTPDARSSDGTLNLTTLNSYHSYVTLTDPEGNTYNNDDPFINTVTFTPNFSGWDYVEWEDPRTGTTSDVPNVVNPDTWSWSPNNSGDYWDTGICQMWYGSISYQDGEAQGQPTGAKTYAVSYKATDNADGVSASANANAQLHDQWEDKVDDSPATSDNDSYFHQYAGGSKIGIENPAGSSGTETAHWTFTITATATLGLSLTANIKPSEASLLGIGIQGNASLSIAVGTSLGVDSPPIRPGFRRYPYVHLQYKTNHYLVDHYTTSGFDAVTKQAADDPSTATTTAGWTAEDQIE